MLAQGRQKITVSIGRQPFAAGNSPITQYMIEHKLFEKHAGELGYDLTPDWRDYPSALPMVEAFVSGNLDLGMWGNTPIIRGIAAGQPWTVLNVGEGHFRFVIVTRPDSDIRNVQDLKGKTIGALLGGDPYNALSQILLAELGSGDPRGPGIKIINTPTQAQAATIPRGMDAADPDLSGLPQGAEGGRNGRHRQLVRLHRGPLQGAGGRGSRHPAGIGPKVALLSGRLLSAPLVLDRPGQARRQPS